jgi:hypothetical protein
MSNLRCVFIWSPPLVFIALFKAVVAGKVARHRCNHLKEVLRMLHVSAASEAAQGWFRRTTLTIFGHHLWQGGWQVSPLVHIQCPVQFYVGLG